MCFDECITKSLQFVSPGDCVCACEHQLCGCACESRGLFHTTKALMVCVGVWGVILSQHVLGHLYVDKGVRMFRSHAALHVPLCGRPGTC